MYSRFNSMESYIKEETIEASKRLLVCLNSCSSSSDEFSSDSSDGSDNDVSDVRLNPKKKRRTEALLPAGFLDPISPPGFPKRTASQSNATVNGGAAKNSSLVTVKRENIDNANHINSVAVNLRKAAAAPITAVALMPSCKQFWKAGDYEGCGDGGKMYDEEMDHVRVHPKFLHSNATSHKWALGAFAELLDNALDENCNGATYVDVDVLENLKTKTKMVVVQDNGGGMTPDKMRQCMSLGYSAKSKIANTIGQYGNGFKTSTMRLGADVIVFSRCEGKYGGRAMQSIGLLSFTFLRSTGKEDIVVPMVDYERRGNSWSKYVRSSSDNWQRNLETVVQWSPYETEEDLLQQFNFLSEKGTRIVIYNLWEDDEGKPELDFDTDQHDIQIGGDDRDEKKMQTAKAYSSTMHYLTYRHSLRSYASILYRRFPPGFRIIIRGKDVEHHDIITDLIHSETISYKPAAHAEIKEPNMSATVTLGFVKDAEHHFDIQGFNVYHKNRLIKPFWRVWNAAGSDGRGVIGVLEANFIEPAHDKQGFERTVALSRLENRLVHFQKSYWSTKCQLIGYAQRRRAKSSVTPDKKASSNVEDNKPSPRNGGAVKSSRDRGHRTAGVSAAERRDPEAQCSTSHNNNCAPRPQSDRVAARVHVKIQGSDGDESGFPYSNNMVLMLQQENENLRHQKEKLQNELEHTKKMMATMDEEQEMFVSAFAEERGRRDAEEESMRKRLKDASDTIQALLDKVKKLEAAKK